MRAQDRAVEHPPCELEVHLCIDELARRVGVDEVKRLAGHADIRTSTTDIRTSTKYVEVRDQRAAEAIAATFNSGNFAADWETAPAP